MGLDMELQAREKNSSEELVEIACWRKANQIREWFKNNLKSFCDNGYTLVEKDSLVALVEDCENVLEHPEIATQVLPTSSGFFFGTKEYDEYYFLTLENTVSQLKEILTKVDFDEDEVYYWEWY